MSLTVTVRDDQTGEEETGHVMDGDYLLVTCLPCRLDGYQVYPKSGTVVLTVKDHRPVKSEETRDGG